MGEADERLPRGPKGDKGDQGDRGEGMTRGARHAVIFLFVLSLLLAAANLLFSAHYANSTQARLAQQQAAQQAVAAKAARKAAAVQLAAAQGECRALEGLDAAHAGIDFSPPSKTGTAELYVLRLVAHIHDVYVHSGCSRILRGTQPTAGTGQP